VRGQFHVSAAVPPEYLWAFWRRVKYLIAAFLSRSLGHPARSLITIPAALSLPVKKYAVHRVKLLIT
jgi:hypothetical protein